MLAILISILYHLHGRASGAVNVNLITVGQALLEAEQCVTFDVMLCKL